MRQEVDPDANIIVGATFDDNLGDRIRVSIVASGMGRAVAAALRRLRSSNLLQRLLRRAMAQPRHRRRRRMVRHSIQQPVCRPRLLSLLRMTICSAD